MADLDITAPIVRKAIAKFSNVIRAENIEDYDYLAVFAGSEMIERINNVNNQIVFGRRGTGKTHLLLALRDQLIESFGNNSNKVPIYVDLRNLLPLLSSSSPEPVLNAILIYRHLINEMIKTIMNNISFIYNTDIYKYDYLFEKFKSEQIAKILGELNVQFDGKELKQIGTVDLSEEEIRLIAGSLNISLDPAAIANASRTLTKTTKETIVKFISFAEISDRLSTICDILGGVRIICLIDEWSEIPGNVQPYLSELLKRSFITSKYVFKIAAIPYRTNLRAKTPSHDLGLEEGGDIFSFYMDNRYIYELNRQFTRDFYNELLYKHLIAIEPSLIEKTENVTPPRFINLFFAEQALAEILIASAGVPRDFINLFINSYDRFITSANLQSKRIVVSNVRLATGDWYNSDKKEQVDKNPAAKSLLGKIFDEIVRNKQKTHFLMPQKYSSNIYVQQLIDLRVIHLRKKGYSHKDIAGIAFDVYSVDYGCYTSSNIYKSGLDTNLLAQIEQIDTIENIRDIRRVALSDEFFDKFFLEVGEAVYCPHCGRVVDTNHMAFTKQKLCNHCYEKVG